MGLDYQGDFSGITLLSGLRQVLVGGVTLLSFGIILIAGGTISAVIGGLVGVLFVLLDVRLYRAVSLIGRQSQQAESTRVREGLTRTSEKFNEMIRSIWDAFLARLRRNVERDTEQEKSQYIPSPLDLSIREAHGGHDVEVERELSKINEQASQIEETERGN